MRFSAFIAACVLCLASEAALRFTKPVWRADLGFSVPTLEGAVGCPLDLPRAEAYLLTRGESRWLEDRFDSFDLWTCRVVRGRWRDADGNELQIARLSQRAPEDELGTVRTRRSFESDLLRRPFSLNIPAHRDEAAAYACPVEIGRAVHPRRGRRRNLADIVSYTTTNDCALVYAFRPRASERGENFDWFLATLQVSPDENLAEVRARFDEEFLDAIEVPSQRARAKLPQPDPRPAADAPETDLLRADVRGQVANYDLWHAVDSADVTVIDDLESDVRGPFIAQLTNNLPRLRRAYAEKVPSPLEGTNALAVVRVFRNREEYLAYVGVEQKWTAALWSPEHRELVLQHSTQSVDELLATVWHEAFHQYLAYSGAMISASPWFNEGHAKLFEYSYYDRKKDEIVFKKDLEAAAYVQQYAKELVEVFPEILDMDYEAFYAGSTEEIAAKYRMAWSIVYFLEVGAPKIRFQPYRHLRRDYMKALVETRSMQEATRKVLGEKKRRDAFVAAWLAFWQNQ